MFRKLFEKWVVNRAFDALYMYHTTHCLDSTSEKSEKVIEVLDYIRGDMK